MSSEAYTGKQEPGQAEIAGMHPRVAVLLLNFNGARDTLECVFSLRKSGYGGLEIVIVDNASSDGSYELLRTQCADCQVIQTGKNLGFAGGTNFGLQYLMKRNLDYALLLNNDTIVEPGFLFPLVEALECDREAAAAGGTICYYPETDRIWYAGGEFVPWRGSSFSSSRNVSLDRIGFLQNRKVSFITGCMMLLRTEAVRQVGLFDERFFMYLEDAEFSLRLLSAGYSLLYVPRARIYHKMNHRGQKPMPLYYGVRNRLLLMDLATHSWKKQIGTMYFLSTIFLKMLFWMSFRRDLFVAAKSGLLDYFRNVWYEGRGLSFLGKKVQHLEKCS